MSAELEALFADAAPTRPVPVRRRVGEEHESRSIIMSSGRDRGRTKRLFSTTLCEGNSVRDDVDIYIGVVERPDGPCIVNAVVVGGVVRNAEEVVRVAASFKGCAGDDEGRRAVYAALLAVIEV